MILRNIEMKRVKRKHRGVERQRQIKRSVDEAINLILPICYVAMKDEFGFNVEQIRAWKKRVDRYSSYISQGLVDFDDITDDLLKAGFYK